LHELLVQLPHEDFVYFADSARVPFGPRPREEIEAFSLEVAEELLTRRIKLLVVACNSASSAALPALRERLMQTTLGVDVLGVVQPGAVQAVAATRNGRVGYMATEATVASGAYEKAIAAADPFVTVAGVACPQLVPLIERGSPFDETIVDAVRHYTRPLREAEVDTVILGCTHYPLIRPMLQRMLGRGVEIVSSGVPVARQVEHVLGSRGLGNPSSVEGEYRFLTSGDPEALRASGTRFLQLPLGPVEHVQLQTEFVEVPR
jgi:glutamate racemase